MKKTGGKPQFWDISLEGCCQKKSENEPNLFLYADDTEIMEYSHSVVAI